MSAITRTYFFNDGNDLQPQAVDYELQNIVDTFNNHNSGNQAWTTQVWKASDNRYFRLSIGYLEDGKTPTLVFQEVTYP